VSWRVGSIEFGRTTGDAPFEIFHDFVAWDRGDTLPNLGTLGDAIDPQRTGTLSFASSGGADFDQDDYGPLCGNLRTLWIVHDPGAPPVTMSYSISPGFQHNYFASIGDSAATWGVSLTTPIGTFTPAVSGPSFPVVLASKTITVILINVFQPPTFVGMSGALERIGLASSLSSGTGTTAICDSFSLASFSSWSYSLSFATGSAGSQGSPASGVYGVAYRRDAEIGAAGAADFLNNYPWGS
jgi:hypothetical protein